METTLSFTISRQYFNHLGEKGIKEVTQVNTEHVQDKVIHIQASAPENKLADLDDGNHDERIKEFR